MKTVLRSIALLGVVALALPASAQLGSGWVVPAAANTAGVGSTYWMTDLTLHNPNNYTLPVRIYFLPSNRDNSSSPVMEVELAPWETYNLWNVLGSGAFEWNGTGAFLIVADATQIECSTEDDCAFLVTSRTFTADPASTYGEYGQGIPGTLEADGLYWWKYGYASGILNDGTYFRTNVGVASWTFGWITVRYDVQDSYGEILATGELNVPPWGHVQERLGVPVEGGTVVFYIVDGPDDALVFPYASVVNQATGDPTYVAARTSTAGVVYGARPVPPKHLQAHPRPLPRPERVIRREDVSGATSTRRIPER